VSQDQTKARREALRSFLITKRLRVTPKDVGLTPTKQRRRFSGLTREELCELTGISVTWYSWLEAARPIKVSTKVLDRLCEALLLNEDERAYLFRLTSPAEQPITATDIEIKLLETMVTGFTGGSAIVLDKRWNIVTQNALGWAIFRAQQPIPRWSRNVVALHFLCDESHRLHVDYEASSRVMVGRLRSDYASLLPDEEVDELITYLRAESAIFRRLWDTGDLTTWRRRNELMVGDGIGRIVHGTINATLTHPRGHSVFFQPVFPELDGELKLAKLTEVAQESPL